MMITSFFRRAKSSRAKDKVISEIESKSDKSVLTSPSFRVFSRSDHFSCHDNSLIADEDFKFADALISDDPIRPVFPLFGREIVTSSNLNGEQEISRASSQNSRKQENHPGDGDRNPTDDSHRRSTSDRNHSLELHRKNATTHSDVTPRRKSTGDLPISDELTIAGELKALRISRSHRNPKPPTPSSGPPLPPKSRPRRSCGGLEPSDIPLPHKSRPRRKPPGRSRFSIEAENSISSSSSSSSDSDEGSPAEIRKSKSTGTTSRRWSLRSLVLGRSGSDGKEKLKLFSSVPEGRGKEKSPPGGYYREKSRRRETFLPYRKEIIGIFPTGGGFNYKFSK